MWDVPLFDLNFDDRESHAVQTVLDSQWLTMGEQTQSFEAEFAKMLGESTTCFAVSSATAALHMSLLALDVGPGDEVIIPALTFVADANVVRMVGATPVLADSASTDNWNISADTVRPKISPATKAVIAVHFAGFPCDMEGLVDLCKEKNVALIEDVAHAPNASIKGRECGTFGDVGCFSFFSNKNLSIGEGGMVVTRDEALSSRLAAFRSHGMSTLTLDRHKGRAISYDVSQVGLNYRMDEMRAAIGKVQLMKLAAGNQRRGEHYLEYIQELSPLGVRAPFCQISADILPAYHIMPVLLPEGADRVAVIEHLKENRIQSSIHYPPFWGFTAYANQLKRKDAPVVASFIERELTLPLYPTMTNQQRHTVVSVLAGALGK